jgi:PIN domain nuclease of toxin-antitoxin system
VIFDTHLLLWSSTTPDRLPRVAHEMIEDSLTTIYFSVVSVWEVAIKFGQARNRFLVDPHSLRNELLGTGYIELPISGQHAAAVAPLPPIHGDPFDRLLIAQAIVEQATLVTSDKQVGRYNGPIRLV